MNAPRQSWTQWIVMALVACLAIFVWEAVSNEPPAADRPHKVPLAVVDIAKVFKEHSTFNEKFNLIKEKVLEFELEVRQRTAEIKALTQEPQPSEENIQKAKKLQENLTADVAAHRQLYLADEARLYSETYSEIEVAVRRICRDRDIGVVFRFNNEFINPGDRASVLQGVNRAVVFSDVPDLTRDVIAAANGPK